MCHILKVSCCKDPSISLYGFSCDESEIYSLHCYVVNFCISLNAFLLTLRSQNSIRGGSRKQDLIALLTSTYKDKLWYCSSVFLGISLLWPKILIFFNWKIFELIYFLPYISSAIFEKTGVCIRISPKAESLIWRVEVHS